MDDRTEIAAKAMEGILIGMFIDRPTAKPPTQKVVEWAVTYADALGLALKTIAPPQ